MGKIVIGSTGRVANLSRDVFHMDWGGCEEGND